MTISRTLAYRPPFDWAAMRNYLAARATPGVETITHEGGDRYWRSAEVQGHRGFFAVGPIVGLSAHTIRLDVADSLQPALPLLLARLRDLLDLDADPLAVAGHLGQYPVLAPLLKLRPGLRVAGAVDRFDLALRTVLGQQVTVRGASTLAGRLVRLVGEPLLETPALGDGRAVPITHLPVTAERLAEASESAIAGIGLPRSRAACVAGLARAVAGGSLPELARDAPSGDASTFIRRLTAVQGIGAWTAAYIAMRALHWPDAFPESDLGLRKAMGGLSPSRLRAAAEAWRPWRAYAAQHLWASLAD
jgi:AraC family transcriptional regulator of adaptative response / DNA-3-methyladenine glycosylase II